MSKKTKQNTQFQLSTQMKWLVGSLVVAICTFGLKTLVQTKYDGQVRGASTVEFTLGSGNDIANVDGSRFEAGGSSRWLGTAENKSGSYLGLRLSGSTIPKGSTVESAKLEFSVASDQWIELGFKAMVEDAASPEAFSQGSNPSKRRLVDKEVNFGDNVRWQADRSYSYDVTDLVKELVVRHDVSSIAFILRGTSNSWGRKFVVASANSDKAPKLVVDVSTSGSSGSTTSTIQPEPTAVANAGTPESATASPKLTATPKQSLTPTAIPTPIVTMTPTPAPTSTPLPVSSGDIFGMVPAASLGTCSEAVHNQYVVKGNDGVTYRTWHPIKDPSGCVFGHDHGDDPSKSVIDSTPPVFGYIAKLIGKDEPHAGFKVHVVNAGDKNDEGSTALHSSRIVFHMGTGGPSRFSARFHSMEYKMLTKDGWKMSLAGMADTGGVGTICDTRVGKTVLGFGCVVDSSYEIWESSLRINNRGQTVASGITSLAVFDPITVFDPNNPDRLVYTASAEANPIFRFNNPRNNYTGCKRETYHGPAMWYNASGSEVYYTDPYGNVMDGGPLKQEISRKNSSFGFATSGLGFIATYKGDRSSEPMTQFKIIDDHCTSGLSTVN